MSPQAQGHRPVAPKKLPWLTYCIRCGLVYLKNDATQRAIRGGCDADRPD